MMSFQTANDIRGIIFRHIHELLAQQMSTFIRTIEHYVDCPLVAKAHQARQIIPAKKEEADND